MKKTSLALLILGLLSISTFAKDSRDLVRLLNERNITQIESVIEADPNNGEAYYMASIYYANGDDILGTNKDKIKQYEYLKQAANYNWPEAQLQYGFYLLNNGQSKDGLTYIQKSAANDYVEAMTMLGDLYFAGYQDQQGNEVVKPNIDKAMEYLKQAVDKGNQDARYTLGHIYLSAELGRQDIQQALQLFEDNIDYENQTAHLSTLITLIDLYTEGKDVIPNRGKLLDYYYLANLQDYLPSFYTIGMVQRIGEKGDQLNVEKNPEAAFINLTKAASAGYVDAMIRVGEMSFKGEGTEQNDVNAYVWTAIAEELLNTPEDECYSTTILELIPKRQRQIAIDNKNHYRKFFSMPGGGDVSGDQAGAK